jgi:hypothetical protein
MNDPLVFGGSSFGPTRYQEKYIYLDFKYDKLESVSIKNENI